MSQYGSIDNSNQVQIVVPKRVGILQDTVRLAHENEQIGEAVLQTLEHQGELLSSSQKNTEEVDQMMSSAQSTITDIKYKLWKKRIFLYAIASILIVINLSIAIDEWRHHGNLVL